MANQRDRKRWSRRSEQRKAKEGGGRTTFNSGTDPSDKGDYTVNTNQDRLLVEDKVTGPHKKLFRVTRALWEKISKEAKAVDRLPAITATTGDCQTALIIRYEEWLTLGGHEVSESETVPGSIRIEREEFSEWVRERRVIAWGEELLVTSWMDLLRLQQA